MIKSIFISLSIFFGVIANAQTQSFLYKGQIDKIPITLYLHAEDNGCGGDPYLSGIYRYDKQNHWLQIDITKNQKEEYAMVEFAFTGAMILKKQGNTFKGIWISPDGKRQLPVTLKETATTSAERKSYQEKLDDIHYQNHDC